MGSDREQLRRAEPSNPIFGSTPGASKHFQVFPDPRTPPEGLKARKMSLQLKCGFFTIRVYSGWTDAFS